jgi:predicted Zn-dependent protease
MPPMLRPLCSLGLAMLAALPLAANGAAEGQGFRARTSDVVSQVEDPSYEAIRDEVLFGREVAAHILGRHTRVPNFALQRYVNLVGRHLAQFSTRPELEFRFAVIESAAINAYSTPGGYVFITSGAIAALQDEAELAAVLAHEIAHVSERHIVRELRIGTEGESVEQTLVRLLSSPGETGRTTFLLAVDEALNILFERGFRKEEELAADRLAALLLANAGYDPLALRRFMARMQGGPAQPSRTHPPSPDRLAALDGLIAAERLAAPGHPNGAARFAAMTKTLREKQQ